MMERQGGGEYGEQVNKPYTIFYQLLLNPNPNLQP